MEKKCIKVIDDDICNRKIQFKVKSEIMKWNRNYKEVDKKIWRVNFFFFLANFDLYNSAFQSLFSQIIRILKLLFRSFGTNFSCKVLCLQRETAFPLSRNKFLLSIGASLVGNTGFSITYGNM